MKILFELFWVCFKIGFLTYGGGYVMFMMFRREMSKKRGWITETELLDLYAIGTIIPGVVAVNTATFIGYNVKGRIGGVAATLGVILPSVIMVSLVAVFLDEYIHNPYVSSMLAGIKIAVVALLMVFLMGLARKNIKDWKTFLIFLVSAVLLVFAKFHIVLIIILSGVLGLAFRCGRKAE